MIKAGLFELDSNAEAIVEMLAEERAPLSLTAEGAQHLGHPPRASGEKLVLAEDGTQITRGYRRSISDFYGVQRCVH